MRRTALGLILLLFCVEASAADIHLKNGSQVTGRIRGQTATAILLDRIEQQGEEGVVILSEGVITMPRSRIERIVLDEGDRYAKTGTEKFEVLLRGEEEIQERPGPTPDEDLIVELPEIPTELPVGEGAEEDDSWHPEGIGDEIQVQEMGVALRIPKGFSHKIVTKGERPVLQVISPPEDTGGVGFNLWIQERRNYAPFDKPENFFELTQKIASDVFVSKGAEAKEKTSPLYRYSKQVGNAPREARRTIYQIGSKEIAKFVEVRVLFTFRSYYVFTFSMTPGLASELRSIFDECFTSIRDLE